MRVFACFSHDTPAKHSVDNMHLVTDTSSAVNAVFTPRYYCPTRTHKAYPKWESLAVTQGLCSSKTLSDMAGGLFPPNIKILLYGNSHLRQVKGKLWGDTRSSACPTKHTKNENYIFPLLFLGFSARENVLNLGIVEIVFPRAKK